MKAKRIITALFMMVAFMQTSWAQGFRIYKSDGTVAQFSFRTDSIVFYDGIGTDVDFGPYTPVNEMIIGKWYKSKTETVTFYEDGKTDYIEGATYEFLPYQGVIIIYNSSNVPVNIINVYKVTPEKMIVSNLGSSTISFFTRTPSVQLVTSITLSDKSVELQKDGTANLFATVLPEDADNKDVTWKSSDDNVAIVNKNGKVMANDYGTCTIICSATDGSGVKAECKVTVVDNTQGVTDGHEWIDLGLPSGTLWATCNVGANSVFEFGNSYAWGETKPKEQYDWSTYKYCQGTYNSLTKYCTDSQYGVNDNKTDLDSEDDAATANWGSGWQTPNRTQLSELVDANYTFFIWTTENGISGRKVISKSNGNSIFLPAAGFADNKTHYGNNTVGRYWASDSWKSYGEALDFNSHEHSVPTTFYRYFGQSVRPVRVRTR